MRKYTAVPHPFLLEPPPSSGNGVHDVGLTLIGSGNRHLAYMIHAFQRAGEGGLGKERVPMRLIEVSQAAPGEADAWLSIYRPAGRLDALPPSIPTPPPVPSAVRLRFETPLRLQRDDRLVGPEAFRFSDLFGSLLRRVSMLTYFHTDTPLETDFAGLMERSRRVEMSAAKLAWKDWTRYSTRQTTAMKMGGLVGEIAVELDEGSPFWPYLWLGQWVHTGKGTSMGLGRYSIQAASLPRGSVAGK
jgi:hypothetical protein